MREYILKTYGLTKRYSNFIALNNVDLSLEAGKIYGLIGQNGVGKTTLMRLIAGLSIQTYGAIELFGHQEERQRQEELKRIGILIEESGLNGNMTARENLRYYRIMRGIPGSELEEELLEMVGLKESHKKKVKNFSLGMKQRLGIAISLLGNPELLLLDEPINGLDPVGIVEVRGLIKKISEERHVAVLISSHNLPELYQTCTDYIIIEQGEIKKILTQENLEEECQHHLLIKCEKVEALVAVLEMKLGTTRFKVMPDRSVKLYDYLDQREKVMRTLFENNILPTHFALSGDTLESYFLSVIRGEQGV